MIAREQNSHSEKIIDEHEVVMLEQRDLMDCLSLTSTLLSPADPSRQIWHRVFFNSIAKRLYRDGFVFKEWFDPVSSKVHYLLSH